VTKLETLIVGVDSLIGQALVADLTGRGHLVRGTTRRPGGQWLPLDLAALPVDWDVPENVGAAILCAAMTRQADCERDPDLAYRINVGAPLALARRLVAREIFVVFPSTSLVFDGTTACCPADALTAPATAYGRMKTEAESAILALGGGAAVGRMTKVLNRDASLLNTWLAALGRQEPVHPFDDMVLSPVSAPFVARALSLIAQSRQGGIWQISASADISYADMARHLARRIGAPMHLVQPVSRRSAAIPDAMAPAHTTLDGSRLKAQLGLASPDPYSVLDEIFTSMSIEPTH
jgi:dTDP-4-dehydrorhamnose reductase